MPGVAALAVEVQVAEQERQGRERHRVRYTDPTSGHGAAEFADLMVAESFVRTSHLC